MSPSEQLDLFGLFGAAANDQDDSEDLLVQLETSGLLTELEERAQTRRESLDWKSQQPRRELDRHQPWGEDRGRVSIPTATRSRVFARDAHSCIIAAVDHASCSGGLEAGHLLSVHDARRQGVEAALYNSDLNIGVMCRAHNMELHDQQKTWNDAASDDNRELWSRASWQR